MNFSKTRIAPTPSGFIHYGNILSFLITAAVARQNGAEILLRIDDMDEERVKKKYVEDIFNSLNFMGIPWDEGPRNFREFQAKYSQVHRLGVYNEALEQLKEAKRLFACDCSRRKISRESKDGSYPGTCKKKNVPFDAEGTSWRLHTEKDRIFMINDISGKQIKSSISLPLRDFVVRRKDHKPAYQVTSVVDDMVDKVDLIVRGKDLWGSTVAQVYLSDMLPGSDFGKKTFLHHPLIKDPEGKKLSKSAGASSIQHLVKSGVSKAGVYRTIGEFLQFEEPVANFEGFVKAFNLKTSFSLH